MPHCRPVPILKDPNGVTTLDIERSSSRNPMPMLPPVQPWISILWLRHLTIPTKHLSPADILSTRYPSAFTPAFQTHLSHSLSPTHPFFTSQSPSAVPPYSDLHHMLPHLPSTPTLRLLPISLHTSDRIPLPQRCALLPPPGTGTTNTDVEHYSTLSAGSRTIFQRHASHRRMQWIRSPISRERAWK